MISVSKLDFVNVADILVELLKEKYGREPVPSLRTYEQRKWAATVLPMLESIVMNADFVEETTIDFDDEQEGFEDCDAESETPLSQKSSQEWEQEKIDGEFYDLDYMKDAVAYYDTIKGKRKWEKFQNSGKFRKVKNFKQLSRFRKYIAENGGKRRQLEEVNKFVFDKFKAAREIGAIVHDNDIRRWGVMKARDIQLDFKASRTWVDNLKSKFRISSRKVTCFVNNEKQDPEEILQEATIFVTEVNDYIQQANLSPMQIINADESGLTLELEPKRTLSFIGEKQTVGKIISKNAVTHSISVMPMIAMAEKVLGKMLVILKESEGKFGPIVCENIFRPSNLHIVCSKSGKMEKRLMEEWVECCVEPAVMDMESALLLLDSYSSHKDDVLFVSVDEKCQRMIIPPHCTPIVQPCDNYFFREFEIFRKRIAERVLLDNIMVDLKKRNILIGMLSLIIDQLSAPIFERMIQYFFYICGYSIERPSKFENVDQVCFTQLGTCTNCPSMSFIQCAHCRVLLCFEHFFNAFHVHFDVPVDGRNKFYVSFPDN